MDFIDDDTSIDVVERTNRTLWVGNLHPKVSYSNIVELFYQVGPIEYVEFSFDERQVCENFACVVFKHSSSVEDSIKLFCNTKLYGIPIITKNYSKNSKDPVFHEQLDYFKQLINVERSNRSKEINKSRWKGQNYDEINIPESLPEPPYQSVYSNPNQDIYHRNLGSMPTQSYKNLPSFYNNSNSFANNRNSSYQNEHNFSDKIYYNHGSYQKSDYNSISDSMEMSTNDRDSYHYQNYDRDSYRSQNYDRKHRGYNIHASYSRKETKNHIQEPLCINGNNPGQDELPVRDLRDTMYRKRLLNYNNHTETNMNVASKPLDLRDTLHHRKNSRYEDLGQHYESDSNNRWSERNLKNAHGSSDFLNRVSRKNYSNSERYIESTTRHKNYNYERNFNPDKSCVNSQEYEYEYPNNYNKHNQDKYTSYNNKFNYTQSQNMESNSHQYNSFHQYKRNDANHKKKEYKNVYNEESEMYHGRSHNKKGTKQLRKHHHL
ncbi:RNA recognition motif domain [Cinara cedri]|uniref:RNA recognition motif domain n=1 Tax=Cinara cedri TaxID=506608 RepID=A0A5E4MMX2_9HEMI|nr:RNA recognition motif domain [Cinara cedri]